MDRDLLLWTINISGYLRSSSPPPLLPQPPLLPIRYSQLPQCPCCGVCSEPVNHNARVPRVWNTTTDIKWAWEHSKDQQLISQRYIFSSKRNKKAAEWGAASSSEYSSLPGCSFAITCAARWIEGKEIALALRFLKKRLLELGKGAWMQKPFIIL